MVKYFKSDEWLSKILKVNSYELILDKKIKQKNIEESLSKLDFNSFVTGKISTKDIDNLLILQECEFKLIDTLIKYKANTDQILKVNHQYDHQNDIQIREAKIKDSLKIAELASKSFQFSRFYLDPNISNEYASKIKYEWVLNYFKGLRGNKLFVTTSKCNNDIVGFILLIEKVYPNDQKNIIVDLIAIDSKFSRKGLAFSLIKYLASQYHSEEVMFCVGTQLGNIPANRLYQKLNFQMTNSSYVLHFHKS